MTRPRKEQISDFQTRYTRLLTPTASGPVWSISGPFYTNFQNATVTKVEGGADESSSAYLTGTGVEPFTGIGVGNQFSITLPGVNGGNPMVVTIQAGDFVTLSAASVLTASFVAARINTTLAGFGVISLLASSDRGRLQIRSGAASSFTVGDSASVTISDVTSGIVQKLGFGAVSMATVSGVTGPKRGIVTRSADNLGGYIQGRLFAREEMLLTRTTRLLSVGSRGYVSDVSPGQVIFARLTHDPTTPSWRLSFFTKGVTQPKVTTSQSRFTTLGAGDILRIGVSNSGIFVNVDVDFGSGPAVTTVQDVINKVNQQWHTATDGTGHGAGRAIVTSQVAEPYNFQGTTAFQLILNGNAPISVTFTTETSAEDVAATINAAITGAGQGAQGTSAAVTSSGQKYVEIRSTNIDGTVSSIVLQLITAQTTLALDRLGVAAGEYHGSVLATIFGGAEIAISGLFRDPGFTSKISLSNQSGTPLAKMGLVAGDYFNGIEAEPVAPPLESPDLGIDLIVPEVLDFGEVPANVDVILPSFVMQRQEFGADPDDGIRNEGRFPKLDQDGRLPASLMGRILDFITATGIQLGAKVSPSASALAPRIITPHSVAGGQYTLIWESIAVPAPAVPTDVAYRFYATNDGRFVFTANAKWGGTTWSKDVASLAATRMSIAPGNQLGTQEAFSVFTRGRLAAGSWNENQWTQSLIQAGVTDASDTLWHLTVGAATALRGAGALQFQDNNTVDPVSMTDGGAENADVLRVLDAADPDAPPVLFKRINSKWTVTCGDGNVSFGDFNGPDSIQQAVAFWLASTPFSHITIQLKSGIFQLSTVLTGITIPDGKGVVIVGSHRAGSTISVTDGVTPAVQIGTGGGGGTCWMKNLTVSHSGPPFSRIDVNDGSLLIAEDCIFSGTVLQATNPNALNLVRCNVNTANVSADKACLTLILGDGNTHGAFKMLDCTFNVGQNHPALLVKASGAAVPLTNIISIEYTRCAFNLSSTTGSGGNLVGNCGIIDVDPNGSDATALTGACVQRLSYVDCQVAANVVGGANAILMHLQPQANGTVAGTGYLAVHRLEIKGGRWIASGGGTFFSPFTISDVGGADLVQPGQFGSGAGGVYISNVTMGFDRSANVGTVQGTMTTDSKVWWLGAAGDAINVAVWGAFAINAFHTELADIQFVGMTQNGGSGDVVLRWSELTVRNVVVKDYMLGGVSSAPASRFRLRPRLASGFPDIRYAHIDGLKMLGLKASAGDWASLAIMVLEPWDSSILTPLDDGTLNIVNSYIEGYKKSGASPDQTGASGIFIPTVAPGAIYTSSPVFANGLTVQNCHVSDTLVGMGFNSATANQAFFRIRYLNNHVINCFGVGILCGSPSGSDWKDLVIDGNFVTLCGAGTSVPGIYVSIHGADNRPFMITNNNCFGNNTTSVQIQCEIPAGGTPNDDLHGVIMGNNCHNGASSGSIKLNQLDGAGAQQALTTPATVGITPIRGCETGHSITVVTERVFTNGLAMIHNVAILETP